MGDLKNGFKKNGQRHRVQKKILLTLVKGFNIDTSTRRQISNPPLYARVRNKPARLHRHEEDPTYHNKIFVTLHSGGPLDKDFDALRGAIRENIHNSRDFCDFENSTADLTLCRG